MDDVTLIGVDLAKRVFHLHGAAGDGSVVFRKKLSRLQFAKFVEDHPRCVVAMEACGSAHHWGRLIAGCQRRSKNRPFGGVKVGHCATGCFETGDGRAFSGGTDRRAGLPACRSGSPEKVFIFLREGLRPI